jgi:hypothetical protein
LGLWSARLIQTRDFKRKENQNKKHRPDLGEVAIPNVPLTAQFIGNHTHNRPSSKAANADEPAGPNK